MKNLIDKICNHIFEELEDWFKQCAVSGKEENSWFIYATRYRCILTSKEERDLLGYYVGLKRISVDDIGDMNSPQKLIYAAVEFDILKALLRD